MIGSFITHKFHNYVTKALVFVSPFSSWHMNRLRWLLLECKQIHKHKLELNFFTFTALVFPSSSYICNGEKGCNVNVNAAQHASLSRTAIDMRIYGFTTSRHFIMIPRIFKNAALKNEGSALKITKCANGCSHNFPKLFGK